MRIPVRQLVLNTNSKYSKSRVNMKIDKVTVMVTVMAIAVVMERKSLKICYLHVAVTMKMNVTGASHPFGQSSIC